MAQQRWQDKLRPASFRGVRFLVDRYEYESGRRGPDHEFPDREDPYAEDTGRRQRKYTIDAYLVGPDYYAGRNKLVQKLEQKGPGDLIHPYYGKKRVMVRDFSVEETAGALGFVKIQIKFVEAGALEFPAVGSDRAFLVDLAGKTLGDGAAKVLTDGFKTYDQAQFVLDSATNKLLAITERMDSISSGIISAGDPLAEFVFSVRNLRASAAQLALSPVDLANNLIDSFKLLYAALSPQEAYTAGRQFFTFGDDDPTIPSNTASRNQEAKNAGALNVLTQTLGLINASNAAVAMSYKSVNDAVTVRDTLADQFDKLMETTTDDDFYSSLQAMRAEVVNAVPGDTQNLARVSDLELPASMPSLVLSYELYGNVDNEQDIIDRNGVRHPGFVPAGVSLEVLDSG